MRQTLDTKFIGSDSIDYVRNDVVDTDFNLWSPCGGQATLLIDTQLAINPKGTEQNLITLDVIDMGTETAFARAWKECKVTSS